MEKKGLLLGRYPPRYRVFEKDSLNIVNEGFNYRGIRYLPVTNEKGTYTGIIRILDFIKTVFEHFNENKLSLLPKLAAKDLADTNVPSIKFPVDSIKTIINYMIEYNVGGLSITDENDILLGEVTEKHIIDLFSTSKPMGIKVQDIMTRNPITLSVNNKLYEAINVMIEKNIRRIPITYENELVGIISVRDIVRYFYTIVEKEGVLEKGHLEKELWYVGTPRTSTIHKEKDVIQLVKQLRTEGIGSLLVIDNDENLVGIVTDRDIIHRLARKALEKGRLTGVETT